MTPLILKLLNLEVDDADTISGVSFHVRPALPWSVIIVAAALFVLCAWWLYRTTPKDVSRVRRGLMAALRVAFFLILLGIIIRPVLSLTVEREARRSLVALLDTSSSMGIADPRESPDDRVRAGIAKGEIAPDAGLGAAPPMAEPVSRRDIAAGILANEKLALLDQIGEKADVAAYKFGEGVEGFSLETPEIGTDSPATALGDALREILRRRGAEDLAAIFLISDGAHNEGRSPLTGAKVRKKSLKHAAWLLIAFVTGGAWVMYFRDAPTLVSEFFVGESSWTVYFFVGLFHPHHLRAGRRRARAGLHLHVPLAALPGRPARRGQPGRHLPEMARRTARAAQARRKLGGARRLHRLQAMRRGLPDRHRHPRRAAARVHRLRPLRRRLQRRDAADRPAGRPDRLRHRARADRPDRRPAGQPKIRWVRPRTIVYVVLLALVGLAMLISLSLRATVDINVLHDRNPLFVTLSDGSIRNGYTIKILNKTREARSLHARRGGRSRACPCRSRRLKAAMMPGP